MYACEHTDARDTRVIVQHGYKETPHMAGFVVGRDGIRTRPCSHRATHRTNARLKGDDLGLKFRNPLEHLLGGLALGLGLGPCGSQVQGERVHGGEQGQGIVPVLEVPCLPQDFDLIVVAHHLLELCQVEDDVGTNDLGIHGVDLVGEYLVQRGLRREHDEDAGAGFDGFKGLAVGENDDGGDVVDVVVGHVVPWLSVSEEETIRQSLRSLR